VLSFGASRPTQPPLYLECGLDDPIGSLFLSLALALSLLQTSSRPLRTVFGRGLT
jgi:hypothetical protein